MDNHKKQLGIRIRTVRERLNLNQKEFADRIGVSNTSVSSYESGDSYPSIPALIRIASTGNVTFDWLILGLSACPTELALEEATLISIYRELTQSDQKMLLTIAEYTTAAYAYLKTKI